METVYKTSNLQLAAYLRIVPGITFKGTRSAQRNKQKLIFLFAAKDLATQEANNFYADTATASAYQLFQSMTALKDMIFESARQEEL